MGVEVAGFEMAPAPVETGTEGDSSFLHEKENGNMDSESGLNEPIKFGSHGDEPVKGDMNNESEGNFPKDAVDEWPAPKQIHSFYFIKYRSYDDPKLKAKLDQADMEIQKKNQARYQITEELRAKRSERAQVIFQLKSLGTEDKQYREVINDKRGKMEPLHNALGKLRGTNNASRERGGICESEEQLNSLIQSMHYHMQHESIPLSEEKKLLREIKQLEQSREKVKLNVAARVKIQEDLGQKEDIQDQVKLIGGDLDEVRKEQQAVRAKIKHLEEELKVIDSDINSLQEELSIVTEKRDKAYATLQELRKQRDEGNSYFYQNRALLNNARVLAAKRDIKSLEELSNAGVEKFMSLWSSSKAFRDDYEKRILPSLDSRQLSRDGRMRNPDEKPLVVLEAPAPSETETVAKTTVKRPKEDSKPPPKHDTLSTQNIQEEANKKPTDSGITLEHGGIEDKDRISEPQKGSSTDNEVDAAKLKEMKRQEEIAKAKLALERKKKQAEKTAAKAAIRAQKEAEKKLKEREKKAKKKAAASAPAIDPEELTDAADAEVAEPEKASMNVEAPVRSKSKEHKESTVRYRNRLKGPDSLSKVILKRKKSTNYWVWAAPAVLLVLMSLVLGYYYLI